VLGAPNLTAIIIKEVIMLNRKKQKPPMVALLLNLCVLTLLLSPHLALAGEAPIQGKRIAMIIGISGYDTSELYEPKNIFESKGGIVDVVSTEKGEAVSGAGVSAKVDVTIDKLSVDKYDAIVFVGGGGAGYYFDHPKAHTIAKETLKQKKILASICAASTILAKAGVLEGKRATGYYKDPIIEHGGKYSTEFVTKDGNLITAIGPNVVKEFAEAIVLALQ
jgi:putative intracellular protease/amidase